MFTIKRAKLDQTKPNTVDKDIKCNVQIASCAHNLSQRRCQHCAVVTRYFGLDHGVVFTFQNRS